MTDQSPTLIENCERISGIDTTPQTIRFVEFNILADPDLKPDRPTVRIIQPQSLENPKVLMAQAARFLARRETDHPEAIQPRLGVTQESSRSAIEKGLKALAESEVPTRNLDPSTLSSLSEDDVRRLFAASVLDMAVAETANADDRAKPSPRSAAAFTISAGHGRPIDPRSVLFPALYQPYGTPHPIVAVAAVYEQTWKPLGYTRGELVGSFSLAPGEELTVEVHTWDKSSRKSEEEIASELELKSSETLTQRDSLSVAREMARQRGTKVEASGIIPIPKFPVTLGASASNEFRSSLSRTRDSVVESTREAANTLRVTRKARVEISRETGREEKQLRVIANANSCHTLNFHYFELVANYEVTTKLARVVPVALINNSLSAINTSWILCHEGVLKKALLDKTFLDGFEAARTFRVLELVRDQRAASAAVEHERFSLEAAPVVSSILSAYAKLTSESAIVEQWSEDSDSFIDLLTSVPSTSLSYLHARLLMRSEVLLALEGLDSSIGTGVSAGDALTAFLRQLGGNPIVTGGSDDDITETLIGMGFEELAVKLILASGSNDGGLQAIVTSAYETFGALAQTAGIAEFDEDAAMVRAEAKMNLDRLMCHIRENRLHYHQAVWRAEAAEQRAYRLQVYGNLVRQIENELIGFDGTRSALPLREEWWTQLPALVDAVSGAGEIIGQEPGADSLTVPTPGAIMEAVLGSCEACESHLDEMRLLEVRSLTADVRKSEAEADRREALLSSAPPDLSPFDQEPNEQ